MSEPTTARDTNVPTTENIAKALRVCFEKTCACSECPFEHEPCGDIEQLAADRLESQEQTIDELEDECGKLKMTINLLTARAEQAEKERDAAIEVITIQAKRLKESHVVLCNICEFEDMIGCVHKSHCDGYQLFKWRGLQPQDGEGV